MMADQCGGLKTVMIAVCSLRFLLYVWTWKIELYSKGSRNIHFSMLLPVRRKRLTVKWKENHCQNKGKGKG